MLPRSVQSLLYGPRRISHQDVCDTSSSTHSSIRPKLPNSIRLYQSEPGCSGERLGRGFGADYQGSLKRPNPAVVVVDSFRTMVRKPQSDMGLQSFIQRLALSLASWQADDFPDR